MKKIAENFLLLMFISLAIFGFKKEGYIFSHIPDSFKINPNKIKEVSGIAPSQNFPDHLWVHEDSDRPATLTLLTNRGKIASELFLPFPNRDWEDIFQGVGPVAGVSYIYLADIGDNDEKFDFKYIYRFLEPKSPSEVVLKYDRIKFALPGKKRDCEAMIIDPLTKNIYIISKWERSVKLFELKFPYNENINLAKLTGEISLTEVTSAAITADGKEIIIRTYDSAYYIKRDINKSIPDALINATLTKLNVSKEPQGEAICFDKNDTGFYTLSEKRSVNFVNLYYYRRLAR